MLLDQKYFAVPKRGHPIWIHHFLKMYLTVLRGNVKPIDHDALR